MTDWKDIHPDFTESLQKQWEDKGFSCKECKKWIDVATIKDVDYVQWLRDEKKVNPRWVLNYILKHGSSEKLREQHEKYLASKNNSREGKKNAQEWLESQEEYNTKEKREKVRQLGISGWNWDKREEKSDWKKLEGDLDLSDFINLEALDCSFNHLTSLKLNNCLKLKRIGCGFNKLTNLDLTGLTELELIHCNDNYLSNFNFLSLNPNRLTSLNISDNNLSEQDLSVFSGFTNLECLWIGNDNQEHFNNNLYNKFHGSLEPLKKLIKLKDLHISNTDIDSGLEYLPDSVEEFHCSAEKNPEREVKNIGLKSYWKDIHPDFTKESMQEWISKKFSKIECKEWLEVGLKINEASFADWLEKSKKYDAIWCSNNYFFWKLLLQALRQEYSNKSQKERELAEEVLWKNIHPDFTEELRRDWKERGFSCEQVKQGISRGLTINDANLVDYYLKRREYDAKWWYLNNVKELRENYDNYPKLKKLHLDFTPRLQELWESWKRVGKNPNFTIEEIQKWINKGLQPSDYDLANYLQDNGHNFEQELDLDKLRKEYLHNLDWKNIHINFRESDEYYRKAWENTGFTYAETKRWMEVSLNWSDYEFAAHLTKLGRKSTDPNIREVIREVSWQDIHPEFYYYLRKRWEEKNMNRDETKKWIEAGFSPDNYGLIEEWAKIGFTIEETKQLVAVGFKPEAYEIAKISVEQWKKQEFTFAQFIEWMKAGLGKSQVEFAAHLRKKGYRPNTSNIKEIIKKDSWHNIHKGFREPNSMTNWKFHGTPFENFTEEITYEWMKEGFERKECKEWLDIGMKETDARFCAWLKNKECFSTWQVINCEEKEELRKEYKEDIKYWQLSKEIIVRIKDLEKNFKRNETSRKLDLTIEQQSLLEELIPNSEVRERYKNYGFCPSCQQPNTWENWCKNCNSKYLQKDLSKWTSGNQEINELIQKSQLEAISSLQILEWIPYYRIANIEHLADGGFGSIYKAQWLDGEIQNWDNKNNKWVRHNDKYDEQRIVILKILHDSQNMTAEFLREVACHKLDGLFVPCYGISQEPKTKNYAMIMQYMKEGDLRQYLKKNTGKLNLAVKLQQLFSLANGLNSLHEKDLVHQDFHTGNILIDFHCYITDFGLCRPANEKDDKKVYGVLPYVAPEILNRQLYTKAADIYSFSMIMYEYFFELPPYHNMSHDGNLAINICLGLRPDLSAVHVPQTLKNLISKCWDSNPAKRPTAKELATILFHLEYEVNGYLKKNAEFVRQVKVYEEFHKQNNLFRKILEISPEKSPELTEEERSKILLETFSEFCQQLNHDKRKKREAWGSFIKFLSSKFAALQTHPQAIYTSRLLAFNNLPEPQNSEEINNEFYNSSKQIDFAINFDDFIKTQTLPKINKQEFQTTLPNRQNLPKKISQKETNKELTEDNWFGSGHWLADQEIDWALERVVNQLDLPHKQFSQFKILELTQFMFTREASQQDISAAISFPVLLSELTGFAGGQLVFIPINNPDFHWSLLVYEKASQTFYHWDTLKGSPNHGYIKPLVRDLLQQLHQNNNPDLEKYLVLRNEIQQPNTWDCGIAVIEITKRIMEKYNGGLEGINLGEFNFPQARINWRIEYESEQTRQIPIEIQAQIEIPPK